MQNYDLTGLSVSMLFPNNVVLTDDKDQPDIYVQTPVLAMNELLNTSDTTIHPAFMVGGSQVNRMLIGKYQGMADGNRLYSLGGEDPAHNITLDTITSYCRNKGSGFHEITLAEWAVRALLAKKRGTMPKGNNNYGKDATETVQVAITASKDGNRTERVKTGTGPVTWSDTGDRDGCWDFNGNVWEWIIGVRLVEGELQVIPYNDAAKNATDLSATSSAWRAINAEATGWDDLFIVPDGTGTTANSVKLDYVSSHWQWQMLALASKSDSNHTAEFALTTIAADVSAFAALYLRAMALAPDDGAAVADYAGDWFYANNGADERCAFRGGHWGSGADGGVFALYFGFPRGHVDGHIGGRPAYYE